MIEALKELREVSLVSGDHRIVYPKSLKDAIVLSRSLTVFCSTVQLRCSVELDVGDEAVTLPDSGASVMSQAFGPVDYPATSLWRIASTRQN